MKKMLIQVFGFLISTVGWFLVCCTVGMDYWRVSYIGGQGGSWIIKAAWYWSTLWRDCYIDSSDVANCRDYDTLWVVRPSSRSEQGPIQAVRALLLVGMFLGFFAALFCFFGMDCTYIGGREKTKNKLLLIGAVFHFTGGVTCFAAYCLFTSRLGTAVFTRMADARLLRYYIGLPVFFGLVGSPCIILGSVLYAVTLYKALTANRLVLNLCLRAKTLAILIAIITHLLMYLNYKLYILWFSETDIYASRKYTAPKTYKTQKKGQTLNNQDDAASTQSRSSSSQVSRSSIILTDRDSFV